MTSLVSTDEVIARVPGADALSEEALQGLIDANEILMNLRAGVYSDERTITVAGYPATVILLPERVAEISGIVEQYVYGTTDLDLDEDDWRLAPGGTAVERVVDGTNPRETFGERLVITFVPYETLALRKNILIQLVGADMNFAPGIQSQTLGDYSETKSSSQKGQASIASIKDDILAQLDPALPVFS